jgi:hypothetical protein
MDEEGQCSEDTFAAIIEQVRQHGIEIKLDQLDYDGILRGIGLVAMQSAHMERVAQALLTALVGGGQASVLIVGQNFSFVYQGIRSALDNLPDTENHREAGTLIERAKRLYAKRSEVIHGDWTVVISRSWQGNIASQYRRYGKITHNPWTSQMLIELADNLTSTSRAMMTLTRRMGFESPGPQPLF